MWVVLSFCLCFCSLTRPATTVSCSARWCFKEFGGLECRWCLFIKKESELGCLSVFCPFCQVSVQARGSPSPVFKLLSYSMCILKEYFNTDAGCLARSRLCSWMNEKWAECQFLCRSDAQGQVVGYQPFVSDLIQVSSRHLEREHPIHASSFFLPVFWICIFLFNCLWKKQ